jgi:hypothetical protein
MKLIMENWKRFLNESIDDLSEEIDILKQYMTAGGERSTDISQAVLSLAGKKPEYKKQLAPKPGTVYRGTAMSKEQLLEMTPTRREGRYLYFDDVPHAHNKEVQSWTYDEFQARKFSDFNAMERKKEPVVFIAEIDDNFVGNSTWLHKLGKEVGLKRNEKETFHVGKNQTITIRVDDIYKELHRGVV